MKFSELLASAAIQPSQVLMLRHRPPHPILKALLPSFAMERPELFNAYQQTQRPRVEAAMKKAAYVASFLGNNAGEALFVGLYAVGDHRPMTEKQFWAVPEYKELEPVGLAGFFASPERPLILWFDLQLTEFYANWKGKLVLDWPGKERSWFRWADRGEFPVRAIHNESALMSPMPPWDEIILPYDELLVLPASWKKELSSWRGIYLILDVSDRKPYVGSAYGTENIYGRWMEYAGGKNGGNRLMQGRDPKNFRFSILQRTSPDIGVSEIVAIENNWMNRLHSHAPHGLNN